VVKALLAAGADVESKDNYGNSAMDRARSGGSDELLSLLKAPTPASSAAQETADAAPDFDGTILNAYGRRVVAAAGIVVASVAIAAALLTVRRRS
jgi:hypothetical protein